MEAGDTISGFPVPRPLSHEYAVAPPAVKVEELPAHIIDGTAERVTVGMGFTVSMMPAVPVQPEDVPVTV